MNKMNMNKMTKTKTNPERKTCSKCGWTGTPSPDLKCLKCGAFMGVVKR